MRAIVLPAFGTPPRLADLPVPEPAEGEVRVRVHASSVNGFDVAVAKGYFRDHFEHHFPLVLGRDFAGTIDALGPETTGYMPGDRIFGVVMKPQLGDGSFAEFVTVPVSIGIAPLPDGLDFTKGGALGLAGSAALAAVEAAAPSPGETVLIAGATGDVGTQALQLAARSGANIIATAHSAQERALVTRLGANEVVDYADDIASQILAGYPDGVDCLLHFAGDAERLQRAVCDGGVFASTVILSPEQLAAGSLTFVPIYANPTTRVLDRLADNELHGRTCLIFDQILTLEEAPQALDAFERGAIGKVGIRIRGRPDQEQGHEQEQV